MIERSAPTSTCGGCLNRVSCVCEPAIDRLLQRPAERQPRGDRCRQSAAGPVRVSYWMPESPPDSSAVGRDQQILNLVGNQVPAFDQNGPTAEREDSFAGVAHRPGVTDFHVRQDSGFVEVRRDQVGARNQEALESFHGREFEQRSSSGRDHHRIQDVVGNVCRPESRRDGFDDRDVGEHPGLTRCGSQIVYDGFDLCLDQVWFDSADRADFSRVLGSNRSDCRSPEHSELVKCLEVCLDSRATARVATRDRQYYRPPVLLRHHVTVRSSIRA